jgi:hypothetical protein
LRIVAWGSKETVAVPKYLPDPNLGKFIVVDEGPHPNGARLVEGFYEGAPAEPRCGACGSRLEQLLNEDGELTFELVGCPTPAACREILPGGRDTDLEGEMGVRDPEE